MDKAAVLSRTILFGGLSPRQLAELAGVATVRELASGEVLFLAGDKAPGLFVIAAGRIRAFRTNAQGREQTIHTEGAGAVLAEVPVFDDGVYPATAVAEQPGAVLFIAKEEMRQFILRHPEVALTALKLMAQRLRGHAELVDALALQQVGQRLAKLLLEAGREAGESDAGEREFDLNASNEELAAQVGSVREVVSRTLARLERSGMIHFVPHPQGGRRRRIVISNQAALARYAAQ